eukprot:2446898-Alexandrium_andersonii.AAC.1
MVGQDTQLDLVRLLAVVQELLDVERAERASALRELRLEPTAQSIPQHSRAAAEVAELGTIALDL